MNSQAKTDFETGLKTMQFMGKLMGMFLIASGAYFVYGGFKFMNIVPNKKTEIMGKVNPAS